MTAIECRADQEKLAASEARIKDKGQIGEQIFLTVPGLTLTQARQCVEVVQKFLKGEG